MGGGQQNPYMPQGMQPNFPTFSGSTNSGAGRFLNQGMFMQPSQMVPQTYQAPQVSSGGLIGMMDPRQQTPQLPVPGGNRMPGNPGYDPQDWSSGA